MFTVNKVKKFELKIEIYCFRAKYMGLLLDLCSIRTLFVISETFLHRVCGKLSFVQIRTFNNITLFHKKTNSFTT